MTADRAVCRPERIAYGPGEWQFGDLRWPEREGLVPLIVLVHGGFWKPQYGLDLMNDMAEDLCARGLATWNIEYRRTGHPGGGWLGTLEDVAAAVDHVRQIARVHAVDVGRVVTVGHSAGGHLALWLAARHRLPRDHQALAGATPLSLAGAISLAGVSDLAHMWRARPVDSPVSNFLGGSPAEVPERYQLASPAEWVPLGVPQILFHGTADDVVPCDISRDYQRRAAALGDPVTYVELADVDHMPVIDPASSVWPQIVQALTGLLV